MDSHLLCTLDGRSSPCPWLFLFFRLHKFKFVISWGSKWDLGFFSCCVFFLFFTTKAKHVINLHFVYCMFKSLADPNRLEWATQTKNIQKIWILEVGGYLPARMPGCLAAWLLSVINQSAQVAQMLEFSGWNNNWKADWKLGFAFIFTLPTAQGMGESMY